MDVSIGSGCGIFRSSEEGSLGTEMVVCGSRFCFGLFLSVPFDRIPKVRALRLHFIRAGEVFSGRKVTDSEPVDNLIIHCVWLSAAFLKVPRWLFAKATG